MTVDREQIWRDAAIKRAREYAQFRSAGLQGDGLHLVTLLAELEQAERERDNALRLHAEALADTDDDMVDRLAKVTALVEALRFAVRAVEPWDAQQFQNIAHEAREALAAWETE